MKIKNVLSDAQKRASDKSSTILSLLNSNTFEPQFLNSIGNQGLCKYQKMQSLDLTNHSSSGAKDYVFNGWDLVSHAIFMRIENQEHRPVEKKEKIIVFSFTQAAMACVMFPTYFIEIAVEGMSFDNCFGAIFTQNMVEGNRFDMEDAEIFALENFKGNQIEMPNFIFEEE